MINYRRIAALAVFMMAACVSPAAEKPTPERKILSNLLVATEGKNLEAFIKDGTDEFRGAMNQHALDAVYKLVGEHMKNGYRVSYLGKLSQQGYDIHLWKLTYIDGHDDTLVKLVLEDKKVAGFFLQ